jgi:hypothetical protein
MDSVLPSHYIFLQSRKKVKVSVSESFENDAISFENAKIKVHNAINNISKNDAVVLDEAFHKALNS